ncbi:hypothetical protein Asi03nite_19040 [Actinoplanes siamensis]|uniref:GtrA-like protein domain-containing protein n=2 Tax=Actinoplanes siamensis TaxID=1223317 RepID=A0A919N4T0_9ACTN|nr:hypothetical protein Asi03nite_19040 [Actinoplanes siamensis]
MLVGALSTVLQTIVYVSVREVLAATWASWLALLVVTPANTEAHRRITFNVTTTAVGRLHWEAGLTSVAVYLANLVVAPWFTGLAGPHPSSLTESLVLALTGSLVGGARYVVLRGWVFSTRRHAKSSPAPATPPATAAPAPAASRAPAATASCAPLAAPAPDRRTRRNPRGRPLSFRQNTAPAGTTATPVTTPASHAYRSTDDLSAALACLGTLAPIPTARLCLGQPSPGVLNQRPPGRLRTWHRNRRQHLTARS